MKGKKPVPSALKELRGTDRPDRGVKQEAKPLVPDEMPKPPTHFNRWSKKVWKNYGRMLKDLGLFTEIDTVAFEMFCNAYGRWIQAERDVAEEGAILISTQGNAYTNPRLHVANKAWDQLRRMLSEFGLTPAERTRVAALMADEEEDDLATLLFRPIEQTNG